MKKSIDTETIKLKYSDIHQKLIDRNIHFHGLKLKLAENPNLALAVTINKDIKIESDNNFWGNVSTLCSIGKYSYSNSNLGYGVKVGRYCSIAAGVSFMGAHHYTDWISTSPTFYTENFSQLPAFEMSDRNRRARGVRIGNDVWIGANVVLKPSITIGDGAIIAGNSVVTKDVPAFAIVGGNPAKIIRYRFSQDIMNRIMELRWWRFDQQHLHGLSADIPEKFLDLLEERINSEQIRESRPDYATIDYFTGPL